MTPGIHRAGPAALMLLCIGVGMVLVPAGVLEADEPMVARAFEVRFRTLTDAAELVGPLLSTDGTLTLRPRLKTFVVEDRVAVLDQVASLLESYDLPPRDAEITLSLFLGTDNRPDEAGVPGSGTEMSREVRGLLENLPKFIKWTAYEPLGSRSVMGSEGGEVSASLSDDYRVVFSVESVHQSRGVVKFRYLVLQHVARGADGEERIEEMYKASMSITSGQAQVVGAATDPNSKKALFLFLQARPR